jgi:DNA (cytosine-5)-methyltransferase 1
MKILNLYAGIGGNRKLWGGEHQVTAVEIMPEIAKIYSELFPNDQVKIEDAHQFLLDHYKEYDFIWSSPPCPTHSRINHFAVPQGRVRYPDMALWQEIIFCQSFVKVPFCIENVIIYYEPLIRPQQAGRHYFWANFIIPPFEEEIQCGRFGPTKRGRTDRMAIEHMTSNSSVYGFKIDAKNVDRRKTLRNCVNPLLALHIFNAAFSKKQAIL